MGLVLRDDRGRVNFSATLPEASFTDPLEVELMAIFRGLQFCVPLGISDLTVESDCLVAMNVLKDGVDSVAVYNHLIAEILTLKNHFGSCRFEYVSRFGNQVAHSLARFAWRLNVTTIWWASCSDFALSALWKDFMNMYDQNMVNE